MPEVNINLTLPDGILINIGSWDASTNLYPATGGTGSGGAVKKGNRWKLSVGGNIGEDGELVAAGTVIEAWVNTPGQDPANWKRYF